MTLHCKLWHDFIILGLLITAFATAESVDDSGPADSSSSAGWQVAKIVSVRKVLVTHYFVSRYPQIHYYMLYLAVHIDDQTYCGAYETPVLDEINDAFAAQGKDVEAMLKEKRRLTVITPKGFRLKAHRVEARQC